MKLAVIGSRTFSDYSKMKQLLSTFELSQIISGGAQGADSLAAKFAVEHNIELKVFYPDWDRHGKKAGMLRNIEIINACDAVLAFWDGSSKGTKHSIEYARKLNKEVQVEMFN